MQYEVKRQHFVPRTYLKNFGQQRGDEYYVKAAPINKPLKEAIFELNITKVCLENDLYTLPGETKEQRMLIEQFYSNEIEQHYNSIYLMLTDPDKANISDKERELVISTVVTMFYRTTKWITQHNELMERSFAHLYELCKYTGKDYFMVKGEKVSIAGKTLEEFVKQNKIENRPSQVMAQLEIALKLIKIRTIRDGIFISKLSDGESEFITSDNPVAIQNIAGGHLEPFNPANIMKLPLDKRHMLFLMPYASKDDKNILIRHNVKGAFCKSEKLISNAEQFQNAERFIIGDDRSLTSYFETKKVAEQPLTKRELEKIKSPEAYIAKGKELGLF